MPLLKPGDRLSSYHIGSPIGSGGMGELYLARHDQQAESDPPVVLKCLRKDSYGEAGRLAVVGSLGAVMGAGWDLVIWGHTPDIWTAAGGIVIITACAAIQMLRHSTGPGVRN